MPDNRVTFNKTQPIKVPNAPYLARLMALATSLAVTKPIFNPQLDCKYRKIAIVASLLN